MVISIVSALFSISIPAYMGIRRQAMGLRSATNQRQILIGLNTFSNDHKDRFPPTFAYSGTTNNWFYYDLRNMTSIKAKTVTERRSLSFYLKDYLPDPGVMQCPGLPEKCKFLPDVWSQGEDWAPGGIKMQYRGSYNLYWGYLGYIDRKGDGSFDMLFRGAKTPAIGKRYSKLLISDSFSFGDTEGLNPSKPQPSFTSCENFLDSGEGELVEQDVVGIDTKLNMIRAPRWSGAKSRRADCPEVTLRAGFADGHVEPYKSTEAIRIRRVTGPDMTMDTDPETDTTYKSMGEVYVPRSAVPAH